MSSKLYFIPLLERALQQADSHQALKEALDQIVSLGRQPEYKQGYLQYQRFMDMARSEMGGSHPGSDAQMLFESDDQLRNLKSLLDEFIPEERLPGVVLERDGERLTTLVIDDLGPVGVVGSIEPGNYSIGLDTGRRLWQGRLSGQDLIWREAFPDEPLPLAADTDQASPPVSREIVLIPDELILKVIPGRWQGRLEIIYLR